MATRKIKDAKDLSTNELIYFKGHAKATFMSDGSTVEDAINEIGAGGGTQGPQGPEGPKGDDGVGITSIVQTTTSSADSGNNVVAVTLTDGTKSTFTVKNGSKGSQGEQGPKGDTGANGTNGKDGADGATFTPSVDSAGNLSWTNNKGLSNPPTVNIKGPKGDSGEGGGSGGNYGDNYPFEVIDVSYEDTNEIVINPNVYYRITINRTDPNSAEKSIGIILNYPDDFDDIGNVVMDYHFELYFDCWDEDFEGQPCAIHFENWVDWANNKHPEIVWSAMYEFSIIDLKGVWIRFGY